MVPCCALTRNVSVKLLFERFAALYWRGYAGELDAFVV